jgi:serine/threonine-protein kinase HipA
MTRNDTLLVVSEGRLVGTIAATAGERFTFEYSPEWLGRADAWPISQTLPLRGGTDAHEHVQRFFANLLPEGRVRSLVTRRLGISESNDFELLKAIGGECAGALSIIPPELGWEPRTGDYVPLSADELERHIRSGFVYPAYAHEGAMRLSLAGAQDKLPVFCEGDRLFLPRGDAASTHIVKFPNRDFKYLPENEALIASIASHLGLRVVDTDLLTVGKTRVCRVKRYDRTRNAAGVLVRIHQEDFCQALGFPSHRKYESEGGPTFADCFGLVGNLVENPLADAEVLIRWHIFNLLAGNADGHAKNLALVYNRKGSVAIAPFYDLVCTALYPRLDAKMAFSVGGCVDPGQMETACWKKLAQECGIGYSFVKDTVAAMATAIPEAAESVFRSFTKRYGDSPVISRLRSVIGKRSRRVLYLIG